MEVTAERKFLYTFKRALETSWVNCKFPVKVPPTNVMVAGFKGISIHCPNNKSFCEENRPSPVNTLTWSSHDVLLS